MRSRTRCAGYRRAARIEVLDDYPYWVGKKFGYFGDIETTLEPGPSDATATVKLVDQNQADFGYPSPGVFSLGLAQGIPLVSVVRDGRRRRVRLRLPEGRGAGRHQGPRRQDHRARQRRLAVDRRPDAEGGGRRHQQGQICRRRLADLGHGGDAGPGRRGAVVGGPARPVEGPGPRLRLHARPQLLQASRRTASSSARRISTTPSKKDLYDQLPQGLGRRPRVRPASIRAPRRRSSWSSSPACRRR